MHKNEGNNPNCCFFEFLASLDRMNEVLESDWEGSSSALAARGDRSYFLSSMTA